MTILTLTLNQLKSTLTKTTKKVTLYFIIGYEGTKTVVVTGDLEDIAEIVD